MYALASRMKALPIISLQTGDTVAVVGQPVLDAGSLEIVAYHCKTVAEDAKLLITRDIRQSAIDCLIIDNEEELADCDDVVRLQRILQENFTPIGKLVVTEALRKLGIVEDFTINLDTNRVQKLYVRQPLFHSWLGGSLMIDRTQIIDVTPKRIVVREAIVKSPMLSSDAIPKVSP